MDYKSDILIIGGGAAGLMAAYAAASAGEASVIVLEKMPRPGRKIMITGKGRCNFSNVKSWNDFSAHVRAGKDFLRPAFFNLPPEKLIQLFNDNGLETVVERGDRAFPASYKSMDVVDTLVGMAKGAGAKIMTEKEVIIINADDEEFTVICKDADVFSCSKLIIATGGLSYPTTGSTGDGYKWATSFGHELKQCFPSLTALVPEGYKIIDEVPSDRHIDRSLPLSEYGSSLCGVSLKNVGVMVFNGKDAIQSEVGDVDFTDGGLEGPIGFQVSRNSVKSLINGARLAVVMDLKPAVEYSSLVARVENLWKEISDDYRSRRLDAKGRLVVLLGKLLPREVIDGFVSGNQDLMRNGRVDLVAVVKALKGWRIPISGYVGYERCVITAGGVDVKEVSKKTMESRLEEGLYFCGEVLDVDADTGGYNLQIAFCTGYLAGLSAAKNIV